MLDQKSVRSKAEKFFTDGEYLIDMDDRKRYYYGLSPLTPDWEKITKYSVTHQRKKRTEIFFENDTVKKLIYEEISDDGQRQYHLEADLNVKTNRRQTILPLTSRGREQLLTPSRLQTPTYMLGQLHVSLGDSSVISYNSRNDQSLPIPETLPCNTREDFNRLTEQYIAMCPADYSRTLENFRNKIRRKVKFTAGDIFRVQITPTLYTYGLILGKVRQLEKWEECPQEHPFCHMMTQPIITRQYAIVTEHADLTANELRDIPLLPPCFSQDNEILWETYPIVDSKKLEERDIDLGFKIFGKAKTVVWGLTMHTFDEDPCALFNAEKDKSFYCYHANTYQISLTYGVRLSIQIQINQDKPGEIPRPTTEDDLAKKTLAAHFGFDEETACDEFAKMFGGITRKQYIELAEKRFQK